MPDAVVTAITIPSLSNGTDGSDTQPQGGPTIEVGRFSMEPRAARPGATLELRLQFDEEIPGLTTVEFAFGGTALGEPVRIGSGQVATSRPVPDKDPGTYAVTVSAGRQILASSEFVLLAPPETASASGLWLTLGLMGVASLAAGWHTAHTKGRSPLYAVTQRTRRVVDWVTNRWGGV